MFSITAFPATVGDCLLLAYGDEAAPRYVLIDGGTGATPERFAPVVDAIGRIELLVVTHVDDDHINGILRWLGGDKSPCEFGDVWFNGYKHTRDVPDNTENFAQGDLLADRLERLGLPWNIAFFGRAVTLENFADSTQVQASDGRYLLTGGLTLQVLSPRRADVLALRDAWADETGRDPMLAEEEALPEVAMLEMEREQASMDIAELAREPFVMDTSKPNRSSIALIAEYDGKRILLAGDAHHDVLLAALDAEAPAGRIKFDVVKLSHHGARGTNPVKLMQHLDCPNFLISTSGGRFRHPHRQTIARILTSKQNRVTLHFNYGPPSNMIWDDAALKSAWGYDTKFPTENELGITIRIGVD